ncbi:MAG: GntR family transcriptional regulator, partial [Planctomycetota bacterium]
QVADRICKLIARNYIPGETLPPYRELAVQFGVGDVTVRKALRVLSERGIVSPIRSRGTVVKRRLDPGEIRLATIGLIIPGTISRLFRLRYLTEIATEIFMVVDHLPGADARIFSLRYRTPDSAGAPQAVVDAGVGGLILLGVPDNSLIAEYAKLDLPTVVVDQLAPDIPLDFVVVDNAGAAATVADRLAELGHRRIAFYDKVHSNITDITGRVLVGQESDIFERRTCFEQAARRLGLTVIEPVYAATHDTEGPVVDSAIADLLRNSPEQAPTAIVATDEGVAMSLIRQLQSSGLRVPEDVSVIGLAGTDEVTDDGRLLTLCRVDFRGMGRKAMEVLDERCRSPRPTEPNIVRIGFEFHPGHTVGPPPRR